jgi:hypothetical protein
VYQGTTVSKEDSYRLIKAKTLPATQPEERLRERYRRDEGRVKLIYLRKVCVDRSMDK